MATNHESLMHKRWAEFLARGDIVGGDIYVTENKYNYVGRIKKFRDNGDSVIFYVEWCAYKTKRGWTWRERTCFTRAKTRIDFVSPDKPVQIAEGKIMLKGQQPFDTSVVGKPKSRAEVREEKAKRAAAKKEPGPLFAKREA